MIRAAGRVFIGIAVTIAVYIGLIWAGLVRDPLWPTTHGDLAAARSSQPGLRVLFVGNSLTYTNSMPAMIERLARADAAAPRIIPVWYTAGGWTLDEAADDAGLARLIRELPWNDVVLQEQSQIGSFSVDGSRNRMYNAAGELAGQAARAGARTILFAPWGWRDGDGEAADSYAAMQGRIVAAYGALGADMAAPVAPVGLAWAFVHTSDPGIELYAGDGIHPSVAGSYLAACVFYVMLVGRDPEGDSFTAGLDRDQADALQTAAWIAARPVTPAG